MSIFPIKTMVPLFSHFVCEMWGGSEKMDLHIGRYVVFTNCKGGVDYISREAWWTNMPHWCWDLLLHICLTGSILGLSFSSLVLRWWGYWEYWLPIKLSQVWASLIKINVKSKLNKVLLGGNTKVQEKLVCRLHHILRENSQLFLKWRISILHSYSWVI